VGKKIHFDTVLIGLEHRVVAQKLGCFQMSFELILRGKSNKQLGKISTNKVN
jgi:hypothetical protein